jgi:hypothetical protein
VFADVRVDLGTRVQRIRQFLAGINEGDGSPGSGDPHAPDAKGLFFVFLYGAYEHCIEEAFREAVLAANTHGLLWNQLRPEILAIALNPQFDGLESSPKSPARWERRVDLSRQIFAVDAASIPELGSVPFDGSHMRVAQIETIWRVLGITVPPVNSPPMIGRIAELVDQRNKIAHGRERPDTVGGRFTIADLQKRLDDIEAVCLYVVQQLETHVTVPANLRR